MFARHGCGRSGAVGRRREWRAEVTSDIHILALIAITMVNILVAQGRHSRTVARDARRLQLALHTELGELHRLLGENLARIEAGAAFLLSARACTTVYRSNLGRLATVPDAMLAPLVRAYAATERLEHLVAATLKANGAMSYRLAAGEPPPGEVLDGLRDALDRVELAIGAVARVGAGTGPGTAPVPMP